MPAFAKLATVAASTKRNPAPVGGKVGIPQTYLTGLLVTPPMPVTPEIATEYALSSPRESVVIYIEGAPDIKEGDLIVIASVDHPIKAAGPWPSDNAFMEVIIQQVK